MSPTKRTAADFNTKHFPTWCPGCGNFGIWAGIKQALVNLGKGPEDVVFVFDIGCSGNMANFIKAYGFHGLHGRSIPAAMGIKLANPRLTVIVIGGDGGMFGEGTTHLSAAMRTNIDLTLVLHDNQVYGLTTGQNSPTASPGVPSKGSEPGVTELPVNPLSFGLLEQSSFVARSFSQDIPHLTQIFMKAIQHKGFSLVDDLQPCVTFNKHDTYNFWRQRVYKLDDTKHNPKDRTAAFMRAIEHENEADMKVPLGIFYQESRPSYELLFARSNTDPYTLTKPNIRSLIQSQQ